MLNSGCTPLSLEAPFVEGCQVVGHGLDLLHAQLHLGEPAHQREV
jgi:hypothetical protein